VAGLAGVGLAVSAWLAVIHYSGPGAAFCPKGSGCAVVDASPYSTLLGVPVALLGMLGYGLILLLALWPRPSPRHRLALHLAAVAGFSVTLYLVYLQLWVIRAVCPYCIVSAGAITAILVLVLASGTALPGVPPGRLVGLSVVLAGVVVLGVALAPSSFPSQSEAEPAETDFRTGLARHLTTTGAAMYGAYWCPHCQDQKDMFGTAFEHINYVECDPRGKGANPRLCQEKGIEGYPTWEVDGRLYPGAMPLQVLAELSGYSP
jgi:uncharacterized membrane protein